MYEVHSNRHEKLSERLMRALADRKHAQRALRAILADKELQKELPKRIYLKALHNGI